MVLPSPQDGRPKESFPATMTPCFSNMEKMLKTQLEKPRETRYRRELSASSEEGTIKQSTNSQLLSDDEDLRKEQVKPNANSDLYSALQAVALALAASDDQDKLASTTALATLQQFCDSCKSHSSSANPPHRPFSNYQLPDDEDNDDTEELIELLRNHYRKGYSHSRPEDVSQILDPLNAALAKLEHRRYSLDPDWKYNKVSSSLANLQVLRENPDERLPCGDVREVNLPMLPPPLGHLSATPLKEKDAFSRSTPPLPVRGAPARQQYLQNRPSTQKLAERLIRVQPTLPPAKASSPDFGEGSQTSGSADSPRKESRSAQASTAKVTLQNQIVSSPGSPDAGSVQTKPVVCAAIKSRPSTSYSPLRRTSTIAPNGGSSRSRIDCKPSTCEAIVECISNDGMYLEAPVEAQVEKQVEEPVEKQVEEPVDGHAEGPVEERVEVTPEQSVHSSSKTSRKISSRHCDSAGLRVVIPRPPAIVKPKRPDNEQRPAASPWQTPRPTATSEKSIEIPESGDDGYPGGEFTGEDQDGATEEAGSEICVGTGTDGKNRGSRKSSRSRDLAVAIPKRQSCGIQVASFTDNKRKGGRAKVLRDENNKAEGAITEKEGRLRRISICEVSEVVDADDQLVGNGKILRQKSKRIRIPPLAWWAGEHIEYRSVDGSIVNAVATAVYKVDKHSTLRDGKRRSKAAGVAHELGAASREKDLETEVKVENAKKLVVVPLDGCLDDSISNKQHWMSSLDGKLPRVMQTTVKDQAVLARWKDDEWVPVSQNGFVYTVKLLLRSLRNTTVAFQLNPCSSKGQDQTRATQMLFHCLSGEDKAILVETSPTGKSFEVSSSANTLSVGDWLVIPPQFFYTVTNRSRSRNCTILAHVVAQDNDLFRSFVEKK